MPNRLEQMLADGEIPIEFANEREVGLFAEVMLMEDVRDFFDSKAGQLFTGSALQDYEEVLQQIGDLPPTNRDNIAQLNELHIRKQAIEHAVRWLVDALTGGMDAERTLHEEREAELTNE